MKTCLITGATSGIGRAVARQLARAGWRLLLTGRNQAAGESLATELRVAGPDASAEFFATDVARPAAVRQLAGWVEQQTPALEVLVNNAGARFNRYEKTEAGVERTFAVNHLGHFLLTGLLKDRLAAAGGARVITLGSSAHFQADPSLGWSMAREHYDGKLAYANSKLACILFAREVVRQWVGLPVCAVSVDPGAAATGFASNNGWLAWFKHRIYHRWKGSLIPVTQAAQGVVQVVSTPVRELQPGEYYHAGRVVRSSPAASDPALARELWQASVQLVNEAREDSRPTQFVPSKVPASRC